MTRTTDWSAYEHRLIATTQRHLGSPAVMTSARAASHFGEHAGGWLLASAVLATADPARRSLWVRAGAASLGAHAAAIVLKRVVRRRRPDSPDVVVGVRTPSSLSFPSAHAASTTAFVVAAGPVMPGWSAAAAAGGMALSRLLLGVHFPSDVAAGAAIGAAAGYASRDRRAATH